VTESILDRVDTGILKLLLDQGLMAPREMAERLGVSDRTVSRHLDRLRELGILKGFMPKLDPGAIPKEVREELGIEDAIEVDVGELSLMIEAFRSILGCGFYSLLYHAGKKVGKGMHGRLSARKRRESLLFEFERELERRGIELKFNQLDFIGVKGSMSLRPISTAYEKLDEESERWFFKGLVQGFLEGVMGRAIEISIGKEGGGYRIEFKRG